jgi:rSAM/selenodomain-associated transferase 1
MTNFPSTGSERQCAYIIFARAPLRGRIKTRLAADIGEEATLLLYEAMLEDTLNNIRLRLLDDNSPASQAFIFAFPPEMREELGKWSENRVGVMKNMRAEAQEGATFGEKMYNAFARVFDADPRAIAIIIGADSPFVEQEVFAEAEASLLAGNAVIGRAEDGGFYLLGLPFVEKSFFFGDNYGNDSVYQRTIEALRARVAVTELPPRGDIDDLSSLRAHVRLLQNQTDGTFQAFQNFQTLRAAQRILTARDKHDQIAEENARRER